MHTKITPLPVSIRSGEPEQDDKKPLNIFWIQRRHITSDQNFEPYLLMPDIGQTHDNGKNNGIEDYKSNNMRYSLTTSHRSIKFMEQKAINPKELFRHPVNHDSDRYENHSQSEVDNHRRCYYWISRLRHPVRRLSLLKLVLHHRTACRNRLGNTLEGTCTTRSRSTTNSRGASRCSRSRPNFMEHLKK